MTHYALWYVIDHNTINFRESSTLCKQVSFFFAGRPSHVLNMYVSVLSIKIIPYLRNMISLVWRNCNLETIFLIQNGIIINTLGSRELVRLVEELIPVNFFANANASFLTTIQRHKEFILTILDPIIISPPYVHLEAILISRRIGKGKILTYVDLIVIIFPRSKILSKVRSNLHERLASCPLLARLQTKGQRNPCRKVLLILISGKNQNIIY